jgi:BirA family biotin operon repressor/biotin-[acetyl-CoA-carboxylase] ligase
LDRLNRSREERVSGEELAEELGCSRQAVSKQIAALRAEGIPIRREPRKGYVLEGPPGAESFSPSWAEWLLRKSPLGRPVVHVPRVSSTQALAAELARKGAPGGLAVVAEEQPGGKGRRGRTWVLPPGQGLAISFLLRPRLPQRNAPLLSLAAAVAAARATEALSGVRPILKWPNDLLFGERKFCGILCESAGEPDRIVHAVIGIGLNVLSGPESFPEELRPRATSIRAEIGKAVPRTELYAALAEALGALLEDLEHPGGEGRFVETYRSRCDTLGRTVRVVLEGEERIGEALGIDEDGALRVRFDDGDRPIHAADLVHLRGEGIRA